MDFSMNAQRKKILILIVAVGIIIGIIFYFGFNNVGQGAISFGKIEAITTPSSSEIQTEQNENCSYYDDGHIIGCIDTYEKTIFPVLSTPQNTRWVAKNTSLPEGSLNLAGKQIWVDGRIDVDEIEGSNSYFVKFPVLGSGTAYVKTTNWVRLPYSWESADYKYYEDGLYLAMRLYPDYYVDGLETADGFPIKKLEAYLYFDEGDDGEWGSGSFDNKLTINQEDVKIIHVTGSHYNPVCNIMLGKTQACPEAQCNPYFNTKCWECNLPGPVSPSSSNSCGYKNEFGEYAGSVEAIPNYPTIQIADGYYGDSGMAHGWISYYSIPDFHILDKGQNEQINFDGWAKFYDSGNYIDIEFLIPFQGYDGFYNPDLPYPEYGDKSDLSFNFGDTLGLGLMIKSLPNCYSDNDCSIGEICNLKNNKCNIPSIACIYDDDCEQGWFCNPSYSMCQPTCETDNDCRDGVSCTAHPYFSQHNVCYFDGSTSFPFNLDPFDATTYAKLYIEP